MSTSDLAARALAIASDVAKGGSEKGADVFVAASRGTDANVRFARNEMTTSGTGAGGSVSISFGLGKRHASATTNQVDDRSLRALATRALAMAKLSPEDPERMPLLPPQRYAPAPNAYDDALEKSTPDARVEIARSAIARGDEADVQIAGFLETHAGESAIAASTGLMAQHRQTEATYTVTARTRDATGSGWGGRESHLFADLAADATAQSAIEKAVRSAKAKPLPPGKYTVVLEPQAVGEILHFLMGEMDARAADEGRSYFAKKTGEKIFSDSVSLESDGADPLTPNATYDHEGFPLTRRTWIEKGRVKELRVSRYWGAKTGKAPTGTSRCYHLTGGTAESIDALVKGTKRGLLVTRFWYNRMLEPQTILVTGLTRDGVFLIEDGKVTSPVANFRYNESPVNVLKNVEAMTKATWRITNYGSWRVPAMRVSGFTMASTSAAV